MKKSPLTFAALPRDYQGLISMFPLRPIHDQVDLDNATEIGDAMAGHDLSPDQEDYFDVLTTLMNEYERAHGARPQRQHDPMGRVKVGSTRYPDSRRCKMPVGTLRIQGRKFRIVSEAEYKTLRAAMRSQRRQAEEEAADLAEARRRMKDPKRKTIPLAQLRAELGL
jgi:hypothetical protein